MTPLVLATTASAVLTLGNLASIAVAGWRLRARVQRPPAHTAAVSIVRPVCGLEPFIEETLSSGFSLDHPDYELLFCVEDADDPVVPLVHRLMAAHPGVPSRLLVGADRISGNPKLNNCVKGWAAARHGWIVLADRTC